MTQRRIPRTLEYLVTVMVLLVSALCLFYAGERVALLMHDEPYDHAIFTNAGFNFWQSGQFYLRVDEPYPTFLPGAAVFKFPPVYQLFIAPWVKEGITPAYYHSSYLACLLMYLGGALLLWRFVLARTGGDNSFCLRICIAGILVSVACVAEPFYNGFMLLVGEIPIFFCCVLALLLVPRYPFFSGTMIALASCTKLYPVFLVLYALAVLESKPRLTWLAGFITGAIALWLLTLLLFGWQEPLYYLTHILPVLLQEHPMGISENLSVIFFLFPDGITHVFAENLFRVIRIVTLGLLAWVTFYYRKTCTLTRSGNALLYGLFITSMVICLANYWIQYEVLLLIPAGLVFATSLQQHRPVLSAVTAMLLLLLVSSNELDDTLLAAYATVPLESLLPTAEQQGYMLTLWETSRSAFLFTLLAPLKPLLPYGLWVASVALLLQTPPPPNPAAAESGITVSPWQSPASR